MSVAEKLSQIAENQQKVYAAGFSAGQAEGGQNLFLYATGLQYTFNATAFPADTELEIYAPNSTGDLSSLMANTTGVKKCVLRGNLADNPVVFRQCFHRNSDIEIVDVSQFGTCKVERFNSVFQQAGAVREVWGEFDFTDCVEINKPFTQAYNLEVFCVKPGSLSLSLDLSHCAKLLDSTVQSLIDGLADLTGKTAQTLTFHSTVGAKLTDAQRETIANKNWTLLC